MISPVPSSPLGPKPEVHAIYNLASSLIALHGKELPAERNAEIGRVLAVATHEFGTLFFQLLSESGDISIESAPVSGTDRSPLDIRISRVSVEAGEMSTSDVARVVRAVADVCESMEGFIPQVEISAHTGIGGRYYRDYLEPLIDLYAAGTERDERARDLGAQICKLLHALPSYRDWLNGALTYHFEDQPNPGVLQEPMLRMLYDLTPAALAIEAELEKLRNLAAPGGWEAVYTDYARKALIAAVCAACGEEQRAHYELVLGINMPRKWET